jgi:hypothetical protein
VSKGPFDSTILVAAGFFAVLFAGWLALVLTDHAPPEWLGATLALSCPAVMAALRIARPGRNPGAPIALRRARGSAPPPMFPPEVRS